MIDDLAIDDLMVNCFNESTISDRQSPDRQSSMSSSLIMGQPFKNRAEALGRLIQFFRQHANVADNRNEARVTRPARHQVNVQVIDDPGASGSPEIDADVDALWLVRLRQRHLCMTSELNHLG